MLHKWLNLIAFCALVGWVHSICRDTETCIERVKEVITAPRRFWFGEQRAALCSNKKSIECGGPVHLAKFHSIATRLFRVKTYHSAYLRNLNIFPRITYRASPGHYRACEHDFFSGNTSAVEADPDMEPVEPFRIRKRPEITWSELQFDDQYTILITDVGFATLNYLVTDFPQNTHILKDYEPTENYMPWSNAMVVVVFRKSRNGIKTPKNVDDFDLSQFMIDNELEDDLVGLSIILTSSDAFSIEKQRIRGNVDYCHSLLKKKLLTTIKNESSNKNQVMKRLPLDELDSWLSISYQQKHLNSNVCCQKIRLAESTIYMDPIGDSTVSALTLIDEPSVSSLRTSLIQNNYVNYHRHTRNFVELSDELFSLALVDAHHGHLHWLKTDIPASQLNAANSAGRTKASYIVPAPKKPSTCHPFIFVLLAQQSPLVDIRPYCNHHHEHGCNSRKDFNIQSFKQQYSLKLSAISLINSCYDLPYTYHVLLKDIENNSTTFSKDLRSSGGRKIHFHTPKSTELCSAFHVSPHHRCPVTKMATTSSRSIVLLLIMFVFFKMF